MLSQLGFEHDVACHRWEELFEDQAPAIVSARAPEPRPEPEPKPKLEPAPAAEVEPVAAEVLASELAKLRRKKPYSYYGLHVSAASAPIRLRIVNLGFC